MRSWHVATYVLLALMLGVTATFGAQTASRSAQRTDTAYQQALLATLDIASNGTVVIREVGTAIRLLGSDYEAATAQVAALNKAILDGQLPGFKSREELTVSRPIPPASEALLAQPLLRCDGPCQHGICCCIKLFWVFCIYYCPC